MTTQPKPHEPQKENIVEQYIQAAAFGLPPEACRKIEKPSPETDQNIVNQVIETSGFGLAKRS